MKPNKHFKNKPKAFWATVRTLSQKIGYSKKGSIIIPTLEEMASAFESLSLNPENIILDGIATPLAKDLQSYFEYRSDVLMSYVEPRLMDADRAKIVFDQLHKELKPNCPLPMNKQKGDKKAPAYLTGIVNMLLEKHKGNFECDYDPRGLTTVTKDGAPLRTLARRVDGAFPSIINPIAIWEIKEYYYTTTFGSRVADGVYETLLDGMELEELFEHEKIDVKHCLIVDAYYTWWNCGKPYLCRMIDMMHMGYVDELLFGYEVVEELPQIISEWKCLLKERT